MMMPSFALEPVDVLVGIDGSENSERALHTALSLARTHNWSVRLVAAYSVPVIPRRHAPVISHDHHREIGRATQDLAEEYAAEAQRCGVDAVAQAIEGDAAGVLVDASRFARLVVVGRRGRNYRASRLLGTVSGRLAAHAHSPVLVVPFCPEDRPETPPAGEQIVEPAAGSDAAPMNPENDVVAGIDLGATARPVAEVAAEAAELLGSRLTLLSVAPTGTGWALSQKRSDDVDAELRAAYSQHLDDLAPAIATGHPELEMRSRVRDGSAAESLTAAARNAAVVVVGTRGRGGFASLLLGSVSRSVLEQASSPVLVVPTGHGK